MNSNLSVLNPYIGFFFEAKREYFNHFSFFFKPFEVSQYDWYVDCSENYFSNDGKVDLFLPDGVYTGEEFKKFCYSDSDYFLHLIRIFAVPTGLSFDQKKIDHYNDYANSNAQLALLSADSFISYYIKDKRYLKECYSSCVDYIGDSEKIKLISTENDDRTGFWV